MMKITFFCTIILHALPVNAVQCGSGEGGKWEILVLTNMKSLPEKSMKISLVHFWVNWKMTFGKVTPGAWIVNEQKFWQAPLGPWHVLSWIWVFSGPWGPISLVKN